MIWELGSGVSGASSNLPPSRCHLIICRGLVWREHGLIAKNPEGAVQIRRLPVFHVVLGLTGGFLFACLNQSPKKRYPEERQTVKPGPQKANPKATPLPAGRKLVCPLPKKGTSGCGSKEQVFTWDSGGPKSKTCGLLVVYFSSMSNWRTVQKTKPRFEKHTNKQHTKLVQGPRTVPSRFIPKLMVVP